MDKETKRYNYSRPPTSRALVEEFGATLVGVGSSTVEGADVIGGVVEEGSTGGRSVAEVDGPTSSSEASLLGS